MPLTTRVTSKRRDDDSSMTESPDDLKKQRYETFQTAYRAGAPPPWDTGIVPPEVQALVAGQGALPPGRALDIGCGTGVSAVYLAAHGWQVTGIDFIAAAIRQARARAAAAGLSEAQVRFTRASVTAPDFLPGHPPVSLWLDIGCMHSFSGEALEQYARHATRLVAPAGLLRLYAWRRRRHEDRWSGLEPEDIRALFAPAFTLEEAVSGVDTAGEVKRSAWYRLRRVEAAGS